MTQDAYLHSDTVIQRLVTEWQKYGKLVIAYDFDNTVFDYHGHGHSYDQVIELLRECNEFGAHLVVFTARREDEYDFVKEYLDSNNIPYDSINEDVINFNQYGRKLYYNILLDDRAGLLSAYESLKSALAIVKSQKSNTRGATQHENC